MVGLLEPLDLPERCRFSTLMEAHLEEHGSTVPTTLAVENYVVPYNVHTPSDYLPSTSSCMGFRGSSHGLCPRVRSSNLRFPNHDTRFVRNVGTLGMGKRNDRRPLHLVKAPAASVAAFFVAVGLPPKGELALPVGPRPWLPDASLRRTSGVQTSAGPDFPPHPPL